MSQPTDFFAADLDGHALEMALAEDEYAKRSYDALLYVVSDRGLYLDRHQAERLRDFLNEALAGGGS